ncbi:MAG: M20/M25/M40 family metallo-hydrolase, partial [Lutibacter sp.]|nr:M20/M25/M40 family metallo-hydrolase [Lutibacter sp.]
MSKKYYQALSLFLIAVSLYYAFTSLSPSSEITTAKTPELFSVEKALEHLQEISKKPHFTGADEHVLVRNYIVNELEKLGLEVEVQTQMGLNYRSKSAANTRNIVARIKGRTKGKALLLLSHYDSAPHASLGASDAGSGVVTILEGVRAFLASNQPPENDVIICFTDAEELGLLGAKAFVHHHPWAQEIGLALNFEARGSGGPSFMLLETNGGNQALIKAFQKASVPYPSANSLMYSVYKMLPNDTDLTVFREGAHIQGFNFAFIDDHFDYHTAQDRWERLDICSLKHQASYLEAALYYFANTDLANLSSKTDQVYFSLPFVGLLSYPFSWIAPTFALCVFLFALLIIVGFLKKKLTKIGVLKGFVPLIFALLTSSLLAVFGWRLLLEIHPSYRNILHGFPYNGPYYMGAFISLTLAICFWSYKGFFTKRSLQDLLIAPLTVW